MKLERKRSSEIKAEGDEGVITGHGSVFDVVDQGKDSVSPGAFAESLKQRMPKMLLNHDPGEVIGVWDKAFEDQRGLMLQGRLNMDIQKGREVFSNIKMGALDGLSIGYRTDDSEQVKGVRVLKKLSLFEVSVVTFPMLQEALISDAKNLTDLKRLVEDAARDAGISAREAKAAAAAAAKKVQSERDAALWLEDQKSAARDAGDLEEVAALLRGWLQPAR